MLHAHDVGSAWQNLPKAYRGHGFLWFAGVGYGARFVLIAPSLRFPVATAATEPTPQQLPK